MKAEERKKKINQGLIKQKQFKTIYFSGCEYFSMQAE